MRARIHRRGVSILGSDGEPQSVDISFNGNRIWSTTVRPDDALMHPWPRELQNRLYGTAFVEVRDSATAIRLAARQIRFDGSGKVFELVDEQGKPLMLNKWLRLAPALASDKRHDLRDDLLKVLRTARDDLQRLGHQIFAVGGTALGPYRDGDFLPHDDDGDLAIFFDTPHPIDVALGMLQVGKQLRSLGYYVRAHSHAHLQVYPYLEDVDQDLYFDVFAAFLKDGTINQPFHVRGRFTREQLVPFGTVTVRGESFPVPADIEAWLTTNYDADWRTPQPGFQLHTPESTVRRFKAWFGSYNLHRHFWDAKARSGEMDKDFLEIAAEPLIPNVSLDSKIIVNLGSGTVPRLPSSIHHKASAKIIAIDYSDQVRSHARTWVQTHQEEIEISDVNFSNYHSILTFVAGLPAHPFDLYAGFALEGLTRQQRLGGFWRFVSLCLRSGGKAVLDVITETASVIDPDNPQSWAIDENTLLKEGARNALKLRVVGRDSVTVDGSQRQFSRILIEGSLSPKEEAVKENR